MRNYFYILFLSFLVFACKNEKEIFESESLTDYMPLQVGNSITYRLDSTVFLNSGSVIQIHKYQVKHTVLEETTDNIGNTTYIIQRLLNNETGTGNWVSNGTYSITPYDNKIDVKNDNLLVTVLQLPLKQGFSWKGNSRLPLKPYEQLYVMAAGSEMNTWNFEFSAHGDENIQGQQYQNVWTVTQNDETLNIPPTPDTKIGTKEVSIEKYAKGIGLVYKDYQLYEYQAASSDFPAPHYTGFGITMWMIGRD